MFKYLSPFPVQPLLSLLQIFSELEIDKLKGNLGVGHTRYSTHGGLSNSNIQPFVVDTIHGLLAVGHNGELVNAKQLRQQVGLTYLWIISPCQ